MAKYFQENYCNPYCSSSQLQGETEKPVTDCIITDFDPNTLAPGSEPDCRWHNMNNLPSHCDTQLM